MKKTLALFVTALFVLGFVGSAFAIHAEIPAETAAVIAKGNTQITLSGQLRLRARTENNFDYNDDASDQANWYMTRLRIGTHVKVSDIAEGLIVFEHEDGNGAENLKWGSGANFGGHLGEGMGILQGWILVKGDIAAGAGLKVGHMPLALGNKTFYDHTLFGDDAILAFVNPNGQTHVAALTVKFDEGSVSDNTDDLDGYVLLGTYNMGDINLGANWTFLNQSDSEMQMHNVGLHADGKIGMINFKASGDFQFGDVSKDNSAEGWAVMGSVGANLGAANVGLTVAYGTGEESDSDTQKFVSFLSPVVYTTYVEDYRKGGINSDRGISGNFLIGVEADSKVTDKIKLEGGVWYIMLSEDVNDEDTIGVEIDVKATYAVTTNLAAWVEGGYLIADDGVAKDADNPWGAQGGLLLSW